MRIWATSTLHSRAQLTLWDVEPGHVRVALAIAHDSTWLATVSRAQIQIWNAHTGACAAAMRTEKALSACSWEPVGYTLIVAGEAGLYRFEFKPPTP